MNDQASTVDALPSGAATARRHLRATIRMLGSLLLGAARRRGAFRAPTI